MAIVHLKRYRMVYDLSQGLPALGSLPAGYRQLGWQPRLLEWHAAVKCASFERELDALVFVSLSTAAGCLQLMRDIAQQSNFVPEATWLLVFESPGIKPPLPVATIQGMRDAEGLGSIQNVGVVPGHRGRGLGTHLLGLALQGFLQTGHTLVSLEVTSKNLSAIRLYERIGFRADRVVYRSVQLSDVRCGTA